MVVSAAIGLFAHAEVRPGGTGLRLVAEDLGARARAARTTPCSSRHWPARAAAGRAAPAAGRALRAHHPVRRAARLGARQLGRARRRHRGRALGGARRGAGHAARWPTWPAGSRASRPASPAAARISSARRSAAFSGSGSAIPAVDRRAARARPRASPPSSSAACCWSTPAPPASRAPPSRRVMRAYERGDRAVTAALHGLREVAERMADALRRGRPRRRRRAARRQLGAPADARPRDVHPAHGPARPARCARPARSAARPRARAPAAACSSSGPDDPAAGAAAAPGAGDDASCRSAGSRRGSAAVLTAARAGCPPRAARRVGRSRRRSPAGSRERAAPLLARPPVIPPHKALLSADGGVCPDDGGAARVRSLEPRRPTAVPRCGRSFSGERHDRAWARFQHLWLAERAATLAALGRPRGPRRRGRARRRDPLRLRVVLLRSFPTATTCSARAGCSSRPTSSPSGSPTTSRPRRCCGRAAALADDVAEGVGVVADEAANVIGEFDEGFSNRQTWHNAALAAIAVWFEDEELLTRAVQSAHRHARASGAGVRRRRDVVRGRELPSLRACAASSSPWVGRGRPGVDLLEDERLAAQLAAALRAPAADRAARPHLSGAQGLAVRRLAGAADVSRAVGGGPRPAGRRGLRSLELAPRAVRRAGAAPPRRSTPTCTRPARPPPAGHAHPRAISRGGRCSRWRPSLPRMPQPWTPGSALLEGQGLAILRDGDRYASLECGRYGGGHGHPDRLHLTLHADGRHWLADPGTGSYVSPRSLLVPLDAGAQRAQARRRSQPPGDARCEAFDVREGWAGRAAASASCRARWWPGAYLLDVVELDATEERTLELPWHPAGRWSW